MNDVIDLLPKLFEATGATLYMVALSLVFGGVGGLFVGLLLYLTRKGNLYEQPVVSTIVNIIVNFFRPIPFIIFIAAVQPVSRMIVGVGIGAEAAIVAMSLAATFGISRLVEQNLLTVSPGVVEAARSAGAGRFQIVWSVVVPEALGPLILGYTFAVVALVDMSAIAGAIGAGGLGDFAIQYGYRQFNPAVTWAAVIVIVVIVQGLQFLGNWAARKTLRR
ncbi:ABC transporter permease [Pseudoclavibacter sp. RFBJ3]|uniref:methionine ABC transporter permease n=1 Tax=unclassified Pseudoclavibacter TaxID=2615177 RepID=UPI000CE8B1B7|nr:MULTISPECIES: methionine ABC transporter permease [unclassified Pseudoclavibacter]MBF4458342.1 ABC transporter permease [Pseudoclavibacter sp. VKM Ac-2867]PPF36017.1 ABC transporter permease [Pseudoclavibacter sp. AY1H1]PPF73559.1 ABC transporter permease [Pseudoclavibacter sp. Z016]PPF81596.1 ABC transporter permease [Pseudoclavibacter sp. RFBJ5]PPF90926.1 ABC transporter permease [Pseudoclavibacter sp. RFBJ3]